MNNKEQTNRTLQELIRLLDIPLSYYEKAVARYQSIADYFRREQSTIRHLDPMVHLQGSFRLGTVIRPLSSDEGYDLDLVCKVHASKDGISQKDLKELIGEEVKSYSREQGFKVSPEDKRRCWTQQYQDEVDFHMDVLPGLPASDSCRRILLEARVDQSLIEEAINITDKEEINYALRAHCDWPHSNPRGFALWFEQRMDAGGYATSLRQVIFESKEFAYESADEVPAYALKTPLQRVVQLLKRHRDEMFKENSDCKPISVIIATLAARAYQGEANIAEAMSGVLDRMGDHISPSKPRIPNPVDPNEDFTDRWDAQLEDSFWRWFRQAREDFAYLGRARNAVELSEACRAGFGVNLSHDIAKASLCSMVAAPSVVSATKVSNSAPSSWGEV